MKCIGEENLKVRFCGWIDFSQIYNNQFPANCADLHRFFNSIFVIPKESQHSLNNFRILDSFVMTNFMVNLYYKKSTQNSSPDCSGNPVIASETCVAKQSVSINGLLQTFSKRLRNDRLQRKAGLQVKKAKNVLLLNQTDCFVISLCYIPRNDGLIVRIRMYIFNFFDGRKYFFF